MSEILTELYRGIPVNMHVSAENIKDYKLAPSSGNMPLPALTLDEDLFDANVALMMDYCRQQGVKIAPHGKTPMAPALAKKLVAAGAWGVSVANIQQAAVMLSHGVTHLIFANEVGGVKSGERLGALLAKYSNAECLVFADSQACLDSLVAGGRAAKRPISVLLELGAGRAGIRDFDTLCKLADYAAQHKEHLAVKGIGVYEGSAEADTDQKKIEKIQALLALAMQSVRFVKEKFALDEVVFTAGGSSYFDLVCAAVNKEKDLGMLPILRSGAIFFFDNGVYQKSLSAIQGRNGFSACGASANAGTFQPALRVWAEVLANPETDLYICSMGKRDVSHDVDLPVPLAVYRDGQALAGAQHGLEVIQLNDQHAFVKSNSGAASLAVGDILEFGISHPCTCFDKWNLIYGIKDRQVVNAYKTYFG